MLVDPLDDQPQDEGTGSDESGNVEALQDEGTPTNGALDESGTPSQRKFVNGRFATADELERSYANLEAEFSRRSQRLSALESQAPRQDSQRDDKWFAEQVLASPLKAVQSAVAPQLEAIQQQTQQFIFANEYQGFKSRNADFAELEPIMVNIADQYRDMISANNMQNDPRLISMLYYAAKGVKQDDAIRNAESKGRQSGEANALRKSRARVEGPSGSKGGANITFEKLSREEMRKRIESGDLG